MRGIATRSVGSVCALVAAVALGACADRSLGIDEHADAASTATDASSRALRCVSRTEMDAMPPAPPVLGNILISTGLSEEDPFYTGWSVAGDALAWFSRPVGEVDSCAPVQIGDCRLARCGSRDVSTLSSLDVGVLSFDDGVRITPFLREAGQAYRIDFAESLIARAGDSIRVRGSGGGGLGPFELAIPSPPGLSTFAPSSKQALARGASLAVTWTAEAASIGHVSVSLSRSDFTASLVCEFPIAAGKGTISGEAIGSLGPSATLQLAGSTICGGAADQGEARLYYAFERDLMLPIEIDVGP